MVPLIGGAIGLFSTTINAVGIGATAGMSYGLGRKYGRKMCEFADKIEGRLAGFLMNTTE